MQTEDLWFLTSPAGGTDIQYLQILKAVQPVGLDKVQLSLKHNT